MLKICFVFKLNLLQNLQIEVRFSDNVFFMASCIKTNKQTNDFSWIFTGRVTFVVRKVNGRLHLVVKASYSGCHAPMRLVHSLRSK